MSNSSTSRRQLNRVHWINHPSIIRAAGYLFLAAGIGFMIVHLVYFPYPQWKDSRSYDLEHSYRIQIDERLGWWASSEIHVLAWIFLPLAMGVMGGAMGGIWIAWYARNNRERLSQLMTRDPFDSAALVANVRVLPLFLPFVVIIAIDLLAPDHSLLDSATTFLTAFGVLFSSMHSPWAEAYTSATDLLRQQNRADAAEQE